MQRIVITGANGAGKSHFAQALSKARPDVPLYSYDALRLTENWVKKPQAESDAAVAAVVSQPAWIIEGGPSVLALAGQRCEGVVWLDPPEVLRAWRLALRPWRHFGVSRSELPAGNIDWPLQQYGFALRSLRKRAAFRRTIQTSLRKYPPPVVWQCRNQRHVQAVLDELAQGAGP